MPSLSSYNTGNFVIVRERLTHSTRMRQSHTCEAVPLPCSRSVTTVCGRQSFNVKFFTGAPASRPIDSVQPITLSRPRGTGHGALPCYDIPTAWLPRPACANTQHGAQHAPYSSALPSCCASPRVPTIPTASLEEAAQQRHSMPMSWIPTCTSHRPSPPCRHERHGTREELPLCSVSDAARMGAPECALV